MNKDKIGGITFCLEDDGNNIFDFNGETLLFTMMSMKTRSFFIYPKWQRLNSKPAILFNKSTGKGTKFLKSSCTICKRTKTKNFKGNTIEAKGIGIFFKSLRQGAAEVLAIKSANNPTRALQLGAFLLTAAATGNPWATAATAPSTIKFIHHGKSLFLGKTQWTKFLVEMLFIKVCNKESRSLWKAKKVQRN